MAKLGEICTINPKGYSLSEDVEVSFVSMTKVGEHGEFDSSEIKKYSEAKKGFTSFQDGDVLFAKITPCMENGKGAIAQGLKNGYGFGSTEFHVLRPHTDQITAEWLYYLTTWDIFRKNAAKNMTGSAGQKRVPKTFLENYSIDLPDVKAQNQQCRKLKKVDFLISLRKQQLAKLDELVKARFVEMFGECSSIRPQKLKEVTRRVKVGFVGTCEKYYTDNTGVPMLRTTNITSHGIDLKDLKYVTKTFHEKNLKSQVHKGDLLIARHGSNGQANVYYGDEAQCLNAIIIEPDSNITNPIFLVNLINSRSVKRQIEKELVGSTQHVLNTTTLANVEVEIPTIKDQQAFAAFVERVDQQKQTVQQSLEKLELMKKALMQEYFG